MARNLDPLRPDQSRANDDGDDDEDDNENADDDVADNDNILLKR